MSISVIYKQGAFYASPDNEVTGQLYAMFGRDTRHGWKFNKKDGWFTTNIKSAALLREYANERAEKIFTKAFIDFTPWKGALVVPKKLSLLPYQTHAVYYSLNRSNSYLALSPGLGKQIIAAIIAATYGKKCVFVCPPFLVLNAVEEFQKWAPNLSVKGLDNHDYIVPDILVIPDSQIHDPFLVKYLEFVKPEVFIGDEWHRFKAKNTRRSKAVYGYTDKRKTPPYVKGVLDVSTLQKRIVMSGTPMPNRPLELFPVLKKLSSEYIDFMTEQQYGKKICGGQPVVNPYTGAIIGSDFTGCNQVEFEKMMKIVKSKVVFSKKDIKKIISVEQDRGFMLRLDKNILGLPLLTERALILGDDMAPEIRKLDSQLSKLYKPNDLIKMQLKKEMGSKLTDDEELHMMTYRRLLGIYKIKSALPYFLSLLNDTEENLFIVAIHKEVISELEKKLSKFNPIVVTGKTPMNKRHELVKEFQTNKKRRIFMGNLDAVGVGFTLTKADRILLLEYVWSPNGNRQVIDRIHRYGLDHEVIAEYMAFRNSLDMNTINTLLNKEKIISIV